MATSLPPIEEPPAQTPLLTEKDTPLHLRQTLHRLETFLRIFGFCQYSVLSQALSWVAFLLLAVALPLLVIELSYCSHCERYQIKRFDLQILISEALVAAISLLSISHNLRKYGIRKFLFVDRDHGHMTQFREQYVQKIHDFFRLLALWVLPCFIVKTACEVVQVIYLHHDSWWQSVAILVASLVSWTYSTIIYLSGSALFNLVCNLQVIHFENYGRLLERDMDVYIYIEEHIRLTHYLSKISHRFRIYLLLEFLVVTASQFLALVQITGNHGIINFINGGNFAVCSIVELVGIILCLHAAAKISHRAQGLASVASRWHASVTCNPNNASQLGPSSNEGNSDPTFPVGPLSMSYSESDLESIEFVPMPTNTQLASNMSSYHKRQAFGFLCSYVFAVKPSRSYHFRMDGRSSTH
ncbi:uncharacterized protein LOC131159454 isoform X2 [Malania oleifera]|uniref:uncharacterized protein LOC131159454 isoform X2 n=1 Tax=Malania oleifera TaxID=397392 RepID=UPI0025AE185C|nr:uncharacterized protein LOC131159454 isoform X2 [Malania oleifera]